MTDRRARARFDIVGSLWGLLEMSEAARVRNVSQTGALIEAPIPVALDSTQTVTVIVNGDPVALDGRVRHVRRIESLPVQGPSARPRYLIGVEFLSPPQAVLESIEQLGAGGSNGAWA